MSLAAARAWRREWQSRVRVAVNTANRALADWEVVTADGTAAATDLANALIQHDAIPSMPLGPLSTIPKLRSTLAATLLRSAHAALAQLRAAAAASAAAAAALAQTAAAMAAAPPPPAPTPVFACLGMPALAACFDRAAAALADDAATRTRVVAAFESLLPPGGADQRAGDALRNAVTVCVVAWKAAPGTAGGGAAAEVAAVAAEMDGF